MKVCILTTSFPRFHGDYAGVFVFDLATWLVRKGVDVEVVAPYETGIPKLEQMGEINVSRFTYMIPSKWQRIAYLGGIPSNLRNYRSAWLQLPFFCLSFLVKSFKACRECDIIHAYWIFSGFIASLLSLLLSKPVVLTVQGSDVNLLYDNSLLKRFRSRVINRIDKIIAVSSLLAERVRSLGAAADKVALIPNDVDTSTFNYSTGEHSFKYRLLWVGRMSSEKGVEYLIRAMSQVVGQFPTTTLTLVGDGPLRPDIERLIGQLGLDECVMLTNRNAAA
jgi:glycosyltransferase involved in cell wall biosynthesis